MKNKLYITPENLITGKGFLQYLITFNTQESLGTEGAQQWAHNPAVTGK
jgi:hypothetical protein